ncbi:kinase-like protein [Bimuria novae-zelandiae CBS 107.79]|uniref:Kinase-like protein n=1 Tax=Bimuria novae-zelandiae CBS 107.79 TaxID=1447943 RepID=A0A6A5V9M4_9PLEO|nr:kinase-like protein [Bimuria novae-zelandiae CBS 107.79]
MSSSPPHPKLPPGYVPHGWKTQWSTMPGSPFVTDYSCPINVDHGPGVSVSTRFPRTIAIQDKHYVVPLPSQNPPRYYETPQRIPEYLPIYEAEPRLSRPRRASGSTRSQPANRTAPKRSATAKKSRKDTSSPGRLYESDQSNYDDERAARKTTTKRTELRQASTSSGIDQFERSHTEPFLPRRNPQHENSIIRVESRQRVAKTRVPRWDSTTSPQAIANRRPFSEADFKDICRTLRNSGKETWSRIPRIYVILRIIDQVSAMDIFLEEKLTDLSFPFSNRTLPTSLKSSAVRAQFLKAQKFVLNTSLTLEKGKHCHFRDEDQIPLQRMAELGKGAFSYVDHVLSTLSYKEYARKLISRGRTFRKDQQILKEFEKELATLKKVSHRHIVELVGSYTDPRYVGILMSPVADCNLKQFLSRDPMSPSDRSFLSTFFGCLASALRYLHENCIRHRDIKPQNVLVKSHQVFLTDFGISRDWSELGHSTTEGPATKTLRYSAPEVAADMPRNSSADIWSLGCVFLEIWTVLCGSNLADLTAHMEICGTLSTIYYQNIQAVVPWCKTLRSKAGDEGLERPHEWIKNMLRNAEDRCTVHDLFDRIQETNADHNVLVKFSDNCCIVDDDVTDRISLPNTSDTDYEDDEDFEEGRYPDRPGLPTSVARATAGYDDEQFELWSRAWRRGWHTDPATLH